MGEVFAGRYELADPIGRGGVGAVWRAWDHRRRRYVAAKVLQQRDAHSLLRFVREQALRIDHPHVLAPASWAADDDKVLFTMDLVAGGSLVHLVGDYGPLPPSFVCTLLDQLLSGLAAVHEEGVVHRDIKPANILLEATGTGRPRLRLSDFGIAMRLGEPRLTETNLVVGTPGYLAPEQMLGAEPDFPADLFAVGLVALYLLEGAKPDAKALVQHFAEHGTPRAPKGIPDPLWQVVSTLLQPDPEARFRTATGARKALVSATELLPEPGLDDEVIEVFDQLGSLPPGFGPDGPFRTASGVDTQVDSGARSGPPGPAGTGTVSEAWVTGVAAAGVARPGVAGSDGMSGAQDVSSPANRFPEQVPPQVSPRPGPSDTDSVPGTPAAPTGPPYRPSGFLPPDFHPSDSGPDDSGPGNSGPGNSGPGNTAPDSSGPNKSGTGDSGLGNSGSVDSGPGNPGRAIPSPTPPIPRPADNSPSGKPPSDTPPSGNSPSDPDRSANSPSISSPSAPTRSTTPASASSGASEAVVSVNPQAGSDPQPFTMSDTGSFHLPPPQPAQSHGTGTETAGTPISQAHPPHQTQQADQSRSDPPHDRRQAHDRHQPPHAPQPHHPDEPPTATAPTHGHVSAHGHTHSPTHALSSPRPQAPWSPTQAPLPPMRPQRVDASTASYTAQSPQVPHPAQANSPSAPPAPRRTARRTHRAHRTRRPGPPAKAALPILLLALACYAVGFWALTRI
ncbi:protein kinase [Streptomyces sp. NPDC102462]|uniref:serine/threonine protein kinase n=1 Tax=Streptomyces sp. NPDC102462 TaxID=3366178 RepID=UPI00381511EA